jgi:demethylmenaquinone methyltransferase/2-methoxy-6-polyprenyl-1,4-benzoquinol methylase
VKLRQTISTAEGKQRYVRRLFATIADRYDFITGFLSYGQDRRWKRRLIQLARLQSSDCVLDLACGTGDIVLAATSQVQRAVGLDVTHRMLQLAMQRNVDLPPEGGSHKLSHGGSHELSNSAETRRHELPKTGHVASAFRRKASFITGDMLALPFSDHSFTVVTIGYGLRNVPDLEQSLREIRRVLVPQGRVLSLDFNRPTNPIVRTAYLAYLTIVGSALGFALHGDPDTYRYIPESIRNYPGAAGVARMMEQLGFKDVRVVPVLGGLMAIHVAPATAIAPVRA